MYDFRTQNQIGKAAEQAFESLLTAAHIPFDRNPYTGTDDSRRADFDHIIHVGRGILVEEKSNPKAAETGNVAVEDDILDTSKAAYFLIVFPVQGGWHGRMLSRLDIERLLTASKLTHDGRFLKYPRVEAGQFKRPSMLVPVPDILALGEGVDSFIKSLTTMQ